MLFSILLIFRKKSDDANIIRETTDSGNKALESIISSNDKKSKKLEALDKEHSEKIENLEKTFQENKSRMNSVLRQKIGDALKDGNTKRATSLLSSVTGIKNLD